MRILGIDPGSHVTGWGVVDTDGWSQTFVDGGAFRLEDDELAGRLCELAGGLRAVIEEYEPQSMAVEQVFAARNARSALILGHARGVVLLMAAETKLSVHEYSPTQVKKAVTGSGRGDKRQVQSAVMTQLGLRKTPGPMDTSDALAVALCHAGAARLMERIQRSERGDAT